MTATSYPSHLLILAVAYTSSRSIPTQPTSPVAANGAQTTVKLHHCHAGTAPSNRVTSLVLTSTAQALSNADCQTNLQPRVHLTYSVPLVCNEPRCQPHSPKTRVHHSSLDNPSDSGTPLVINIPPALHLSNIGGGTTSIFLPSKPVDPAKKKNHA